MEILKVHALPAGNPAPRRHAAAGAGYASPRVVGVMEAAGVARKVARLGLFAVIKG
jgi:hypothetical protein